jgi:hypothetical protein
VETISPLPKAVLLARSSRKSQGTQTDAVLTRSPYKTRLKEQIRNKRSDADFQPECGNIRKMKNNAIQNEVDSRLCDIRQQDLVEEVIRFITCNASIWVHDNRATVKTGSKYFSFLPFAKS